MLREAGKPVYLNRLLDRSAVKSSPGADTKLDTRAIE
jgi:hypothetical protein